MWRDPPGGVTRGSHGPSTADEPAVNGTVEGARSTCRTTQQSSGRQRGSPRGVVVSIFLGGVLASLVAPGRFSPDALDMYDQALDDTYHDWHSPILAGVWGVFDLPPEFVLLLFVTMVVVGAMLVIASETSVTWAVVAASLVCIWPMTFGVLVTVSKDAWFAGFFLSAAAASAFAIRRTGRERWVLLGIAAAGLWLAVAARPNAIVPVTAVLTFGWPLASSTGKPRWLSRGGFTRIGLALLLAVGLLFFTARLHGRRGRSEPQEP